MWGNIYGKKVAEYERDVAFKKTKGRTETSDLRNLDILFVGAGCHTVLEL